MALLLAEQTTNTAATNLKVQLLARTKPVIVDTGNICYHSGTNMAVLGRDEFNRLLLEQFLTGEIVAIAQNDTGLTRSFLQLHLEDYISNYFSGITSITYTGPLLGVWTCTITAGGHTYQGTGNKPTSLAVALTAALADGASGIS